jgi:quinol monooxygenase YgiN
MAYVVIATWIAREGEEEAVARAIGSLTEPSRSEPGNLAYEPLRSPEDPRHFVIYEKYADAEASRAHSESEHFRLHGLEDGIPRLERRERLILEDL